MTRKLDPSRTSGSPLDRLSAARRDLEDRRAKAARRRPQGVCTRCGASLKAGERGECRRCSDGYGND